MFNFAHDISHARTVGEINTLLDGLGTTGR
jgi:hypothetical protein